MKYSLAIFDLDGTILDTLDDLTITLNASLSAYGFPERTKKEVKHFVGNGIKQLVNLGVPDYATENQKEQVFDFFNEYYTLHCADNTKAYDGIKELLTSLRNMSIKTAVVSNKSDYAVHPLCDQYFPELFDIAVGSKDGIRRKPYPDSVFEVLDKLDSSPDEAVYIGDSEVDIQTSANAQLDCISVDWGFRDRDVLVDSGATTIVSTPQQLFDAITK